MGVIYLYLPYLLLGEVEGTGRERIPHININKYIYIYAIPSRPPVTNHILI